jgi:hypothetical protein
MYPTLLLFEALKSDRKLYKKEVGYYLPRPSLASTRLTSFSPGFSLLINEERRERCLSMSSSLARKLTPRGLLLVPGGGGRRNAGSNSWTSCGRWGRRN